MILFARLAVTIGRILHVLLMIYLWIIIIRAILSWLPAPSLTLLKSLLFRFTEPVLRPLRRLLPPYRMGGIDISPILAVILILFIDSFLVESLILYGEQILRQQTWRF